MNVSEAGLAELYRNLGREVPEGVMVNSLAVAQRKEKYGRVKKEVDGIVFDSTLEAEAYKIIKLWELTGAIKNVRLQPMYMLQEGFRDVNGKWHRAITYQADFEFVSTDPEDYKKQTKVVDAKGMKTEKFRIKEKMFVRRWPTVDFQLWDKAKVKELSRC